jgi:hypothetical protein
MKDAIHIYQVPTIMIQQMGDGLDEEKPKKQLINDESREIRLFFGPS